MDSKKESLVVLSEEYFIGEGSQRRCYIYPDNERLCVKILMDHASMQILKRDLEYNRKLMKKGFFSDALPRYYGEIKTNKGIGYVFDLIRDYDNKPSKSMIYYLFCDEIVKERFSELVNGFKMLQKTMYNDAVVSTALNRGNILYQKNEDGSGRLVLIDDLGTSVLIPFEYYFLFVARMKVKKRWKVFFAQLKRFYADRPLVLKLIEESAVFFNKK